MFPQIAVNKSILKPRLTLATGGQYRHTYTWDFPDVTKFRVAALIPLYDINVKNFGESLTTVVMAQNDTSKTANITDTILDRTLV